MARARDFLSGMTQGYTTGLASRRRRGGANQPDQLGSASDQDMPLEEYMADDDAPPPRNGGNGGPDPQTNALVCPLVVERIRFNPARNAQGEPVAARYGWRQEFFRARR